MSFLYIQVYHGLCASFGSIGVHKPQFVYGFRDRLQKLGFRVDLVPVDQVNYCMVEMCGHEVFRCNILQLQFNTEESRDIVCQRAVDAVLQASVKFRRARAYLWFWTYLDHELFKRGEGTMPDYWVKDVDFKPYEDVKKCIQCCKIFVKAKPKELNQDLDQDLDQDSEF